MTTLLILAGDYQKYAKNLNLCIKFMVENIKGGRFGST